MDAVAKPQNLCRGKATQLGNGGSGIITAFRPDSVTVNRGGEIKKIDALIGTGGDLSEKEDFDAILNPKILI